MPTLLDDDRLSSLDKLVRTTLATNSPARRKETDDLSAAFRLASLKLAAEVDVTLKDRRLIESYGLRETERPAADPVVRMHEQSAVLMPPPKRSSIVKILDAVLGAAGLQRKGS